MSRLAPLEPPYAPDAAKTLARMMPEGMDPLILFRTIAHNPRVLSRFSRGSLLDKGSIPLRVREILILRTCARSASEYEWGVHVSIFAKAAKLSDAQIEATAKGNAGAECWDANEADLICLADSLHDTSRIDDKLWTQLAAVWSSEQLVEMVVLCGFYHTVSFVTGAFDIALEDDAARFPN